MNKLIGVIGYGSFTREIICSLKKPFNIFLYDIHKFSDIELIEKKYGCKCFDIKQFDYRYYNALVTLSNGHDRKNIIKDLPHKTDYYTYISDKAVLKDKQTIFIKPGSIICDGVIMTTNISVGKFTQLNLNTTIGHDTIIEDFCTTAPGVHVSGNCYIGKNVYIGTNSSVKEKIHINDNVIIGMNSGVTKNISEPGTYVGTPTKKL